MDATRAIDLLLASAEPAVGRLARRDVLNEPIEPDPEAVLSGPLVRALLGGQQPDGGFGCHPWQWPDGGWNCDLRASGRRSSFNESLAPAWGLHEYWLATGASWARAAAHRAAELFLEHRLFRSLRGGEVINGDWLVAHYPPYWHYDVPQALLVLARLGKVRDSRANEAVELLLGLQREDGCWHAGRSWWRPPGGTGSNVEVVDWGRRGPSQMITLNALRVLSVAGKLAALEPQRRN